MAGVASLGMPTTTQRSTSHLAVWKRWGEVMRPHAAPTLAAS